MLKRVGMICCALGLVVCLPGVSNGAQIFLSGTANTGAGTIDVNKVVNPAGTGFIDFNYCWAASAANILAFTEWDGGTTLGTGQQIYDNIKANWTNAYGVTRVAAQWWFTGDATDGGAVVTTAAMQTPLWNGFYSAADFSANSTAYTAGSLSNIAASLAGTAMSLNGTTSTGYATTVRIAQYDSAHNYLTGAAHYVTAWGVDDAADQLWITDSDDQANGLQQYSVTAGGFLSNGTMDYRNWQITGIWGLASNGGNIAPNGTTDPGSTPVPEPSTVLLFGSGLIAVISRRRKTK